jgi:ComF family protein
MLKIISSFIDVIFPPRETAVIVRKLTKEMVTQAYSPEFFKHFIYLSSYQSPVIQALIKENKFHHNKMAATLLAQLLEKWLTGRDETILLIPVPLSAKRLRERGYNQVMEVLRALATNPHWHVDDRILERKRHTTPQTNLSRTARLHNMSDAFEVTGDIKQTTTLIILVDDVVTTGATLNAAYNELLPHISPHTQLRCVALAH